MPCLAAAPGEAVAPKSLGWPSTLRLQAYLGPRVASSRNHASDLGVYTLGPGNVPGSREIRSKPVGAHNSVVGADQGFRAPSWGLMCRILYRFLALLVRLAVRSGHSKDLEISVLRHQLGVLHRRNNRPQLADEDRTLLSAVPAALSRPQRPCGCQGAPTCCSSSTSHTPRILVRESGSPKTV